MSIVTYSYARQNLAKLMDEVERDRAPIHISRQRDRGAAVLVSEADWDSMQTTLHLLSNPHNSRILREGIAELDAGGGIEHDIIPIKAPAKEKRATRK
ncbi:MAG TPA: type II toxin-antitoxin system prevent-host-death family antitoxin [Rhizomicrobium sp.]